MIDIAYACALYPMAGYQLAAAVLRTAPTVAPSGKQRDARQDVTGR